jgi:hypothetical protein
LNPIPAGLRRGQSRRFAFLAGETLCLNLAGWVHCQNAFLRHVTKKHPDGGHVLFDGRRRTGMLFDVSGNRDRLNVLQVVKTAAFAPSQELTDRVIVRDPGVFVADRNREEFEKALCGFGTNVGDQGRNRKYCIAILAPRFRGRV